MRSIRIFSLALPLMLASCVHHAAEAGVNADASIAGVRAQIGELNTALAQVRTELTAGRDVNQNDKWTLRLLGLGVLILGLSYPIGKFVWLTSMSVRRRMRPAPMDADMVPLSNPSRNKADTLVAA